MSRYFVNPLVRQPNPLAVQYHREWIKRIKNKLGSKCIFLQHVREVTHGDSVDKEGNLIYDEDGNTIPKPDNYFVVATFEVDGGKQNIKFQINGTIADVSNENYVNLEKDLLSYARTEGII